MNQLHQEYPHRQWLVILFLACDDRLEDKFSDEADLKAAAQELNAYFTGPNFQNTHIHLVMCIDGLGNTLATHTKLYYLGQDQQGAYHRQDVPNETIAEIFADVSVPRKPDGTYMLDTGSGANLHRFVAWACKTFPATHRMLSIVSHGGGWAPGFGTLGPISNGRPHTQPTSGGVRGMPLDRTTWNSLSTLELERTLNNALQAVPIPQLDVLFLDACLMGAIECAYELRKHSRYLIAGQNLLWSELPYRTYLDPTALHAGTAPESLVMHIVDSYDVGLRMGPFVIAALNLEYVEPLARLVEVLASELLKPSVDKTAIRAAYDAAQKFDNDSDGSIDLENESVVDLLDFAEQLVAQNVSAKITEDANKIIELIGRNPSSSPQQLVVARARKNGKGPTLQNGHREDWKFERAFGVSIFLPLGSKDPTFDAVNVQTTEPIRRSQAAYYTDRDQLSFTHEIPSWVDFIDAMRQAALIPRITSDMYTPVLRSYDPPPKPLAVEDRDRPALDADQASIGEVT